MLFESPEIDEAELRVLGTIDTLRSKGVITSVPRGSWTCAGRRRNRGCHRRIPSLRSRGAADSIPALDPPRQVHPNFRVSSLARLASRLIILSSDETDSTPGTHQDAIGPRSRRSAPPEPSRPTSSATREGEDPVGAAEDARAGRHHFGPAGYLAAARGDR
jgi:hypothetical protein